MKKISRITTLSGFLQWAEYPSPYGGQYHVFRGVSYEKYLIEASTYRRREYERYSQEHEMQQIGDSVNKAEKPKRLLEINEEMIKDARSQGHGVKNGILLSDLDLLAELQHYGAATCLIDFTYNAAVALWFACQESSKGSVNGKVVAVDLSKSKKVHYDLAKKGIHDFFIQVEDNRYPLYHWRPENQNPRIMAQQSIFILGGAAIEIVGECIIPKDSKQDLLISLQKSLGITESTLFPDFEGFARQRAHNKIYTPSDARDYIHHYVTALFNNRIDDAIAYCTEGISLKPRNRHLAILYSCRAEAYTRKGKFDFAIEDYNNSIELERSIDGPHLIFLYRARGQLYENKGEYDLAIKDYSEIIELASDDLGSWKAAAYLNRGRMKKHLNRISEAEHDFKEALMLAEPDNDTDLRDKIEDQLRSLQKQSNSAEKI